MELSRYVVLNPVRAGLTEKAADWRWRSYRSVMGETAVPAWLAVEETLQLFHAQRGPARRAYARFVTEGVNAPDPTADAPRAGFIGGEAFIEQMLDRIDQDRLSPEIARKFRPAPSLETIANSTSNQNEAICRAYATTAYTLIEIAGHFGLHLSTVSRITRRDQNARNKT